MKILFVSTSIPPYPDMQAIRNVFLINGLTKNGNSVDIVTAEYPWNKDDLLFEFGENINIIRTSPPLFLHFLRILNEKKFLTFFGKIMNVLVHYIAIPDISMFWDIKARRKIKELGIEGYYDVIITSSGSYTAHLVGNWASKKFNIPWIAEYGDPWGFDSYGKIKKLNRLIEKHIVKRAAGIVLTTENTLRKFKEIDDIKRKYSIVYCGFDKLIDDYKERNESILKFGYLGVAYASSRNLFPLLENFKDNKYNVSLSIIGNYSKKYMDTILGVSTTSINFEGRVSYKESIELIGKLDVLVHIGNKGIMQIPGKTFIYLSSRKPIVYIRQEDSNDPTFNILKEYGGIIFCENNKESISLAIIDVHNNYKQYKNQAIERVKKIGKYSWSNQSDIFAEFVREIGAGKRNNNGK